MKLINDSYRFLFIGLIFLSFCFFESCKEKERVIRGKLEQVASDGTGLVSFKLNGSKTELREFPKAFFDSLKTDYSQPFNFKYKKQKGVEFASLDNVDAEFLIIIGSMFPQHADPDYSHKKYHTFKNISTLFEPLDLLNVWEMKSDNAGGVIIDTLVCSPFFNAILSASDVRDTIFIHFNESPVILQKNIEGVLSSPLPYKVISNITYDSGHPHQEVGSDGN